MFGRGVFARFHTRGISTAEVSVSHSDKLQAGVNRTAKVREVEHPTEASGLERKGKIPNRSHEGLSFVKVAVKRAGIIHPSVISEKTFLL